MRISLPVNDLGSVSEMRQKNKMVGAKLALVANMHLTRELPERALLTTSTKYVLCVA